MSKKKNEISAQESLFISTMRSTSMIMIVLCHIANWFPPIAFTGQVLNVGVPLFFIISGFIYGQKKIVGSKQWLINRWLRISVPLYLYYSVVVVLLASVGKIGELNALSAVKCILNLQGFFGGGVGNVPIGHLWFISYILICYLMTPLLQCFRESFNMPVLVIACAIVILLNTGMVIVGVIKTFWIPGIVLYCISYYVGAFWNRKVSTKCYIGLSVAMLASILIRLLIKYISEAVDNMLIQIVYEGVVAVLTHCILAVWIFVTVYLIVKKYINIFDKGAWLIKIFDQYSYEVYIVHYMFLIGVLDLRIIATSMTIATGMFLGLTLLSCVILKRLSSFVLKRV